jgi:hypothetical protein
VSTVDGPVELGVELTFGPADGPVGTTRTDRPALRTASELTVIVTDAHRRTSREVLSLLDRILDDRTGLFEAVHIDRYPPATTPGFGSAMTAHVTDEWGDRATSDTVDSYYDYEASRLLVTPDRYLGDPRSDASRPDPEMGSNASSEPSEST